VEAFPDDLKKFMDENIDSVEQLEILRLVGEDPGKEWDAASLAREVQTPLQTLAAHIAALQARGLVRTAPRGAEQVCAYGPRTPELDVMLGRLLKTYRERPVTMIKMVYARAQSALKAFADAFRVRKEG